MTHRELLIRITITLALAAVVLFGPIPVTIDGFPTLVAHRTTVADLVDAGRIRSFPGDLYDVKGGLLMPRAGGAPVVEVDGSVASSTTVVGLGAIVSSLRGADSIEATVSRSIESAPSLRYRGHGPVESVEESGTPGLIHSVRGAVSGIEIDRVVVRRPSPVTVRREPAWRGRKRVALTFDDGPWAGQTEKFLTALKKADARATFFMLGRQVTRHPALARKVRDAGMQIGAHSQSHKYLQNASNATIRSEIRKGVTNIEKVLGKRPIYYRPAGGSVNSYVFLEARRLRVKVVMWTVDPHDYRRPGARVIARRILDNIRPGSVVLMHDGGGDRTQTLKALRLVLRGLKARGYETVTLSELYSKPKSRKK